MKHTLVLVLLATFIITACAPVSALISTPSTALALLPTDTPAPTVTSTSTATLTLTPTIPPTATPTPIPTIQVGNLTVPDPRYTNPELFDFTNPDAPISQFINALRMIGTDIEPSQVAEELTYQATNGVLVATYYLDPDPDQHGETLEGSIPLFIGERAKDRWRYINITTSLRKLYDGYRFIGSQVVYYKLNDPVYVRIAAGNFNQLSINGELNERILWKPPSPVESPYERYATYDLSRADQLIAFAKRHRMRILASHLVDPRVEVGKATFDLPEWLEGFDKDEYVKILKARVRQSVSHFGAGTIFIVVNEAFDWDRLDGFWLEKIGPEYIEIAFEEARIAKPEALLIYNDVNVFYGGTLDDHDRAVFGLVNSLKSKGLIDGVGFQMHIDEEHKPVSPDVVRRLIEMYERIGVKVYVTEFDVDLTYLGLPEQERQRMKTQIFGEMLEVFLTSPNVESISFFGFTSDVSWKPDADSHLFNEAYRPEPAFYEVARLLLAYYGSK